MKRMIIFAAVLLLSAAAGAQSVFAADFSLKQIYNMPTEKQLSAAHDGNFKYLFKFLRAMGCREGVHQIVNYILNDNEIVLVTTVEQGRYIMERCRDIDSMSAAMTMTLEFNNQLYTFAKEEPVATITLQGKEIKVRSIVPGIKLTAAAEKYRVMMK